LALDIMVYHQQRNQAAYLSHRKRRIALITQREWTLVVVLGRNLKHLISVVDDLQQRQIGFKVLAGAGVQIDTTTANGRLVFGIFAALAEFEAELIRERTRAGLAAARTRGRRGGRPRKI